MAYLMGIDVSTTGCKALIINEKGEGVASMVHEYPLSAPRPNWSEQAPVDWWQATVHSIREALEEAEIKGADIACLGLSGQMHGLVLLDKSDRVLRPAILWNDQRTGAECDDMARIIGRERLIEITCNPPLTGFTAPKILWVKKHEPEVYDKVAHILLPKDYIRYRLTGALATEVSDASGTLLFDVPGRCWSEKLLQKLGIDRRLLPDSFESPEVSGKISAAAAEETGLAEGTPVVGGGGDQAAGAVGNGIVKTGAISATIGTSGVVFAFSDSPKVDLPQARTQTCCHAVPGKWHIMGVSLSSGGSLRWFRDNLGQYEVAQAEFRSIDPYEVMTEEAAQAPPGSEGLVFLPYLTGERTPVIDPDAKGAWVGLNVRHTKGHLLRSIMEGVAYSLRDSLEIMKEMGIEAREIRVSGGGARSALWRQIQADVYNHTVLATTASEGPAFGVALLAGVGSGLFSSVEEACEATIKVVSETKPKRENVETYKRYFALYRGLYGALKETTQGIAGIICSEKEPSAEAKNG
jgi:xylulokinase